MALCVVLFGTVMMVTGCGTKPKAGTVWQVTAGGLSVVKMYFCFHSDGNAYVATKAESVGLVATKLGAYTIDKKTITIEGESFEYKLKGEKMTFTGKVNGVSVSYELQKVSSPTEKEIANAVK